MYKCRKDILNALIYEFRLFHADESKSDTIATALDYKYKSTVHHFENLSS